VLLVTLALLAAAQNLLPGMPGSPLKIPFLTGVAVYYALNRPLVLALVAAVWAGWIIDSAGGLPASCTPTFLLLLALILRPLRRFLLDGTFAGVVAAATAAVLPQALWQIAYARVVLPENGWRAAGDLVLLLPAGALAGAVAYGLTHTFDRFAGNVKPQTDGERIFEA